MPIFWRSEFSVGNNVIDNDHQHLFNLINSVELIMRRNKSYDDVSIILNRLHEYTNEHFAREEKIQNKIGFPSTHHKSHHDDLIKRLAEIRRGIKDVCDANKAGFAENAYNAEQLTKLLRYWILDHVILNDLKMKPYFLQYKGPKFPDTHFRWELAEKRGEI